MSTNATTVTNASSPLATNASASSVAFLAFCQDQKAKQVALFMVTKILQNNCKAE